jgi:hypothetical protein
MNEKLPQYDTYYGIVRWLSAGNDSNKGRKKQEEINEQLSLPIMSE